MSHLNRRNRLGRTIIGGKVFLKRPVGVMERETLPDDEARIPVAGK